MFFSLNILVFSQHFLIYQTWNREIIQQIQVQKAKNLIPFSFHVALVSYHGGHMALFIYLDFWHVIFKPFTTFLSSICPIIWEISIQISVQIKLDHFTILRILFLLLKLPGLGLRPQGLGIDCLLLSRDRDSIIVEPLYALLLIN